jgi:hypothetical protein
VCERSTPLGIETVTLRSASTDDTLPLESVMMKLQAWLKVVVWPLTVMELVQPHAGGEADVIGADRAADYRVREAGARLRGAGPLALIMMG